VKEAKIPGVNMDIESNVSVFFCITKSPTLKW
jgi:hypothetical protein